MHSLSVRLSTEHREGRGRQAGCHDGLAAVTQIQAGGVVVLLVVRLRDHCVGWLGLRRRVGRWCALGLSLSQILVTMSEGARGTVFARAHVEVLALGSFKVLAGLSLCAFTHTIPRVVVAAASSLLVSALTAAPGLMTTTSATAATTLISIVVVVVLLVSTSVGVLMIVMMSTATTSAIITVSVIILRLLVLVVLALHALVVLLNNGGLGVGVRRYGVGHLAQLVLTMGEEARVGLRARTLLHEVAAKLGLELLGVELGS